jgi:hypothetical protein
MLYGSAANNVVGMISDGNAYAGGTLAAYDVVGINDDGSVCYGGDVTSATADTLTDSGESWTENILQNKYVVIAAGVGAGQVRKIESNTSDTITVVTNWAENPDATSDYKICDKAFRSLQSVIQNYTLLLRETDHTV